MDIARVGSAVAAAGLNGATTAGFDTTGANLIILSVTGNVVGAFTVTDNKSNTWTALTAQVRGGTQFTQLYYCVSPTVGGGHTFTLNSAESISGDITAAAYSDAAASPYYSEAGGSVAGATLQPGSVTPPEDGCLVVSSVGIYGTGVSVTPTVDSGFTRQAGVARGVSANQGGFYADLIQTTAGAVNPTWDFSPFNTPASATIAVFKPAAGGGGESEGTGTAAGGSTVGAVGARVASSTGTAAGGSTVGAVGARVASSTGAAAGGSTVGAVGQSVIPGAVDGSLSAAGGVRSVINLAVGVRPVLNLTVGVR